jgi:hypothetical protein
MGQSLKGQESLSVGRHTFGVLVCAQTSTLTMLESAYLLTMTLQTIYKGFLAGFLAWEW